MIATVAVGYVGYRILALGFIAGIGFPPYAVPVWALAIGVAVDLAYLLRAPLTAAVLAPGLAYLALWGQSIVLVAPPSDLRPRCLAKRLALRPRQMCAHW